MSDFQDCGYLVVKNFFDINACNVFTSYALHDEKIDLNNSSLDVPHAHFKTNEPMTRAILLSIRPAIEKITGLLLKPTASHFRIYRNGSILKRHHDQVDCCQVTASINIGSYLPEGESYPVYLEDQPFNLNVGDLLLFRGHELNHSRELFTLDHEYYQIQVFVHYVERDKDAGIYEEVV